MLPFSTFYLWLALGVRLALCVLELPVFSEHAVSHSKLQLRPRQLKAFFEEQVAFETLEFAYGGYYIDVTIGSPPQEQRLYLSTGSSDLHVNSAEALACQRDTTLGPCDGGTFNASASTTYKEVEAAPAFNLTYSDGRYAVGPFGNDVLRIGSLVLEDVQFGIGDQVDGDGLNNIAMMGLGYATWQRTSVDDLRSPYQSVLGLMVREKIAASRLFSITLGRRGSPGSVVFGGIDSTRYTGPLVTINLINRTEPYYSPGGKVSTAIREYITTITQAEFTTGNETSTLWSSGSDSVAAWLVDDPAIPVIPELNTDLTWLPAGYYDEYIAPRFPFVDSDGACLCDYADTNDKLILTFGDKVKITVAVEDLIKPATNSTSNEPTRYANGTAKCFFTIRGGSKSKSGNTWTYLGKAITSNMYMVFDQDNDQISIAQAALDVAENSNIIPVEAGPGGVAKALAGLNISSTPPSGAPGPSVTSTPAPDPPGPTNNTGAIAGGVVGGVGGLALIGGAAYFLMRRRKTKKQPMSEIQNDFGQDFEGTYVQQPKNPRYNGDPTLE
ncbi:hypothetical protein CKM354_000232800 [Cercospora kikuchii]|uniref:Peptidase A1 domain-containing protein n=1 Tax=Cercospora kikuchii TaxID=84275 RepID=A0A9P3CEI1_9PEZI|nr:uncharacterized protein CKM354_000232800 [Cercospora kikuchii]GIZ38930.1 hypothetical protein CKM354_000232800 [Cercospora kikuchii]